GERLQKERPVDSEGQRKRERLVGGRRQHGEAFMDVASTAAVFLRDVDDKGVGCPDMAHHVWRNAPLECQSIGIRTHVECMAEIGAIPFQKLLEIGRTPACGDSLRKPHKLNFYSTRNYPGLHRVFDRLGIVGLVELVE